MFAYWSCHSYIYLHHFTGEENLSYFKHFAAFFHKASSRLSSMVQWFKVNIEDATSFAKLLVSPLLPLPRHSYICL
jgi:hypothetical protein